jgi:protein-disulfide isomerase
MKKLTAVVASAALLLAGAASPTIDAPDEWGRTPLIVALQKKDAASFDALLGQGASIRATDAWGRTPLLVAMQVRDTAAARKLIERGADVNAANRNDITPLISAAQTGNLEAARLLLDAGAAPNRVDNLGLTALDWAERRKLDALATLLRSRGAMPGAVAGVAAQPEPAAAAPFAPRFDAARAMRGDPSARITIYEYTDLQCPYCAQGAKVAEEVLARYHGQVRLVLKHLPLPAIHPQAMRAAQYFEAIALQDPGAAWSFYDRVFGNQAGLAKGEDFLAGIAAELGVDRERLAKDLGGATVQQRIEADLQESRAYRFDGVPAFVVEDKVLRGAQPAQRFVEVIEAALAR